MTENELKELLSRYQAGKCTDEERAFLKTWYAQWNQTDELRLSPDELEADLKAIAQNIPALSKPVQRPVWHRIAAAASVILCISVGSYFYFKHQKQTAFNTNKFTNDVLPGGNKAILTLANGRKIILTGAPNGNLAQQNNTIINKLNDGEVAYNASSSVPPALAVKYDTLTIPAAGQFHLKLADGSNVWLNSLTQIRYPESFTGNERVIELISGEAYLEVVHNPAMPFRVKIKGQTINDVGTHFNINAYADEPAIRTTLTEGAISVTKGDQSAILNPGQVAVVSPTSNLISVKNGNPEEAIAWKNGYFRFNDENIHGIMRQLARWYNIEVSYSGDISNDGLTGKISRFKNISQVLLMLESTKLFRFKVEGRRVTVTQ